MKKLILMAGFILWIGLPIRAFAAPFNSQQLATTSLTNGYVLQTNGSINTWVATSSLGIAGGTGSSTNYFTNAGSNTTLTTGTNLLAPVIISSSTRIGGAPAGYANLTVQGGQSFSTLPGFGTSMIGLINSTTGWNGSGFLFTNASAGSCSFSLVSNNDTGYFGQVCSASDALNFTSTPALTNFVAALTTSNNSFDDGLGNASIQGLLSVQSDIDVVGNLVNSGDGDFYLATGPHNSWIDGNLGGNVGIGTESPVALLDVAGSIYGEGCYLDSATTGCGTNGQVLLSTGAGTKWTATSSLGLSGGSGTNFLSNSGSNTFLNTGTNLQAPTFNATSTTGTSTFVNSATFGGKVGIGTTTPTAKLEVAGNGYFSGNLTAGNITATGTFSAGSGSAATPSFNFSAAPGNGIYPISGSAFAWAVNAGRGGDFTTSGIKVYAAGGAAVILGDAQDVGIARNAANVLEVNNGTPGTLATLVANNIGIGTSSPTTNLSIQASTNVVPFFVASSTGATLLNIGTNGRVGVGTTSPDATFTVFAQGTTTDPQVSAHNVLSVRGDAFAQGILLQGGNATSSIFGNSPVGGNVTINGGNSDSITGGSFNAGSISLTGGIGNGVNTIGGSITLTGGKSMSGNGGDITINPGLLINNNSNRNGYLLLSTNATTTFVGIGTSTPDSGLDVKGSFRLESSSTLITSSISGAIVGLGCDSATSSVSDQIASSTTAFITTPQNYPGDGLNWFSYLSAKGVVTTKVCADVTVTPTATAYVIKIIR